MDIVWISVSCLMLVGVYLRLTFRCRRLKRDALRMADEIESLRQQQDLMMRSLEGHAKSIRRAEKQLSSVTERQSRAEVRSVGDAGYAQAVRLARQGESAEKIMELCDLTRGELELIQRMNVPA